MQRKLERRDMRSIRMTLGRNMPFAMFTSLIVVSRKQWNSWKTAQDHGVLYRLLCLLTHNRWHVALCYLEGQAPITKVRDVYDHCILKELERSDAVPVEVYLNAVGLLLRVYVCGELDLFGDRLRVLANNLTNQAFWFLDLHFDILTLWALSLTGEFNEAENLLKGLKSRVSMMSEKKRQLMLRELSEMARTRVTARKSVTPVTHRETFQLDIQRPHDRVSAAIRLKELAIENQDKIIRRLRASNLERRKQVESLTSRLTAAERRIDDVCHMLDPTKDHNYGLHESLNLAVEQVKRTKEEMDQHIVELTEVKRARLNDQKKIDESWNAILQLSENNKRMSKEVDKAKEKKKELVEKHKECHEVHRSLLGEAAAGIHSRDEEITTLKFEKQNLQWQIEDMLNPEEDPEKDPEVGEAPPDAAVGNGEIE